MSLPYFYSEQVKKDNYIISLEEGPSRHITQVLRMEPGERLLLTDGKGNVHSAEISQIHKKSTGVKILSSVHSKQSTPGISIAISLIKNTTRFEWFLEKATEIGVNEIIPLLCERTEKHHFRLDRMKSILVSAMLQSQQAWLPELSEPRDLLKNFSQFKYPQKFIAHCEGTEKHAIRNVFEKDKDVFMLIGPEGDFTQKEIEEAIQNNFLPVTLGETRLRTETAGIVAACLLKNLL
ncbi:MAG: RsmE family RNA methyltransferase [Chitinophagaceae bacterium]